MSNNIFFFLKSYRLWDNVENFCTAGQTTDDKIQRMHIACCIIKVTNTHTHTEYVILIAFPLQRWLHERASVLSYTYIACLVARKVVNIIIHGLLQLHSITSLSHRNFQHGQWFRPTKNFTCLGIAYAQHRKMCILWKGQEIVFKVMTKIPIPVGSLTFWCRNYIFKFSHTL